MAKTHVKEPMQYPAPVRRMNFFETDRNLERALKRIAPDTLKRRRPLLKKLGQFASTALDEQAQEIRKLGMMQADKA